MRQKIALAIASVAATVTLTVALAMAGMAPDAAPSAPAPVNAESTADPSPRIQVDTVYLKPAPTQEIITIQQTANAGETEGPELEGGEDDD